jgi:hypothetical protein
MTLDDYENNADQAEATAQVAEAPQAQQYPPAPTYQEIQAYAQLEAEKAVAINNFKQNHPELTVHERYIQMESESYAIEEMQKGNYVTPAQALAKGVERFTATLPKSATEKAPEDSNPVYQMLETGNEGAPMSGTQRASKLETMSAADFRKLSDSVSV